MILYKFIAEGTKKFIDSLNDNESALRKHRSVDVEYAMSKINKKFYTEYCMSKDNMTVVSDLEEESLTIVVAYRPSKTDIMDCIATINKVLPEVTIVSSEEITVEEYRREITRASMAEWIQRSESFFIRELGLNVEAESRGFFDGPSYKIKEKIFSDKGVDRKASFEALSRIMASDNFTEEIKRIYSRSNMKKFLGHPVHYLITAGDKGAADDMISILIPALMKNKRLVGGRVCEISDMLVRAYRDENFINIFSSAEGETVVINLSLGKDSGMHATAYHELIDILGKKLNEYGNDTLFIFVDVSNERTVSDDAMAAILANADMIRIDEGYGDMAKATEYLDRLASQTDYKYETKELTKYLPKDKYEYTVSDIYSAYRRWYGSGLKTHVYRAYKEQDIVKLEIKKKLDKPYEELQKMIGLSDVKRVTDEILSAARVQKMRKAMGLDEETRSLHMLFSGNPGTAKTTVARLLAQILKDEEVLKNGHIVECGRQDLVGKYVGWTAKIVEEKFRAARGGILFIDEAYSLVEDHNLYGAEAINTIVQLMENYREEVIVIFAGYSDRMQEFLDQNEGLRSRISFHLDFPNYDENELSQILDLMVSDKGYNPLDDQTKDKCQAIFKSALDNKDFGNGRFVRNTLEHAIMRQANRLCSANADKISKDQVLTLTVDDFETIGVKKTNKTMGLVG